MGLFSKNKKNKTDVVLEKVSTYEKIIFESLSSDDDKYLTKLADKLMDGQPLILNFDKLDIDQANKVIAFLSGIVYAVKGEILNVQEKVFMFALGDVYQDGSMDDFLKEIVE
ncbi:MAG: cell division protein SepF [Bacillota bacterium]|nr:MAG: cell division protein SepF [Bacillota bacterium]